jgi:hypothetical protein
MKRKNKMVLTPQQVKETLTRQDKTQLKQLEVQIDQALLDGNITITVTGGLNPRVKDKLLHRYQDAGWQVNYQQEQRTGYLFFAEPRRKIGF